MKKLLLIILILVSPYCKTSKKLVPPIIESDIIVKNLKDFFQRTEQDIQRAKKVIVDEDIVKNLSHLLKMDSGGKKFYILERENITKVIKSVTEAVYTDFILINRSGVVIYTMVNDDIFGKNVRTQLKSTPLFDCYNNIKENIYFHDISTLTPAVEKHSLFAAVKVKGGISFPGLFVLQISTKKLITFMEKESIAVSRDGIYRVSGNAEKILSTYEDFELLKLAVNGKGIYRGRFTVDNGVSYRFRPFSHGNIYWMIISGK